MKRDKATLFASPTYRAAYEIVDEAHRKQDSMMGPSIVLLARNFLDEIETDQFPYLPSFHEEDRVLRHARSMRLAGPHSGFFRPSRWEILGFGTLNIWRKPVSGFPRRYDRLNVLGARGCGKTYWITVQIAYDLYQCPQNHGTTSFVVSYIKEQSQITMDDMDTLILSNPHLRARTYRATHRGDLSFIKIPDRKNKFSKQSYTKDARNISGHGNLIVFFDELQAFRDDKMIQMASSGMKGIPNSLIILSGNAGREVQDSVSLREKNRSVAILRKEIPDLQSLGIIGDHYEGDKERFIDTPAIWHRSQLSLPDGLPTRDYLLREADYARNGSPDDLNEFLRAHGDFFVSSFSNWIDTEKFKKCEKDPDAFDEGLQELRTRTDNPRFYLAVDLSSSGDYTALALIHDFGEQHPFYLQVFIWRPSSRFAEADANDLTNYRMHHKLGNFEVIDCEDINYAEVAQKITEIIDDFGKPVGIAFDEHNMKHLRRALRENHGLVLSESPHRGRIFACKHMQGFRTNPKSKKQLQMTESIRSTENQIYEKNLIVRESPLLRAAVSGVKIRSSLDGKRKFMVKNPEFMVKIDPIVASIMAIGFATEMRTRTDSSQSQQALTRFYRGESPQPQSRLQ